MHKDDPLEYLWQYFERHSSQRLQMFNYYILVNIATLTGIGICLKENQNLIILPAILLLLLNETFRRIDERTVFMIKSVEKSLKKYEKKNFEQDFQIFLNEEKESKDENMSIRSYSSTFSFIFNITDFISIIFIGFGLWKIFV